MSRLHCFRSSVTFASVAFPCSLSPLLFIPSAANECCWVLQFLFVISCSTFLKSQLPCSRPYPPTATLSRSWHPLAHCPHDPITIALVTQPQYRRREGRSQLEVRARRAPRLLVCQIASCCRWFVSWLAIYFLLSVCLNYLNCLVVANGIDGFVLLIYVCYTKHTLCLCCWSTCVCQHGIVPMCLCCWSTCVSVPTVASAGLNVISSVVGHRQPYYWLRCNCICVHEHCTCVHVHISVHKH